MIKVARKVLCLDWDKRSLRIVVARLGGGADMELEDAHAHSVPNAVDPEDPKAMGAFIAQQLQSHHISLNRAIVDVSRDKAVINRLTVPPTPLNELAAAVRFQAMRELPFPLDEAEIDYVVTETNEEGLAVEVLLAAVRSEVMDRLRQTCEAAGLTPARIGLRPYANMVSVMHLPAMMDRRVLFVDVGPTMTEIDVVCGKVLAFSRAANVNVPFYGGELDMDDSRIASRAELIGGELSGGAEATAVNELAVEITRTLQAYRATEAGAGVDQIIVAGGTGIEEALVDVADSRFQLPATVFDPTPSLGADARDAVKLRAFASTLGLAWGLSKEGLLELDFLNPKKPIPPGQELRRRLRIGGIAAAVALVLGAAWLITDRVRQNGVLRGLEDENAKLKEEVVANVEIDIKRMEADEWASAARAGVWLDHLLWITQQTVDIGKKMVITDVNFNSQSESITVKLLCSEWEVANEFAQKLNDFRTEDGKRLYRADQGAWAKVKTVDPKFKLKVDCRIDLLELNDRTPIKQRKREYDKLKRNS